MEAWESLQLTPEEADKVEMVDANLKDDQHQFALSLVGSLWSHTPFNVGAFKNSIAQIWRLRNNVEIKEIGKNLFTFHFQHWKDKEGVLSDEPWWFDKRVLCLQEFTGDERPSEIKPHSTPF